MVSRHRTRPVTCSTNRALMASGSVIGVASTLAIRGTAGASIFTPARAFRIALAKRCRLIEAERAADGDHELPHLRIAGRREVDRLKIGRADLEDGEVVLRRLAAHIGWEGLAVGEGDGKVVT